MEPHDVEILVHVAAPSKVADDETYRRLARAYLAFQPETRVNVTPSSPPSHISVSGQASSRVYVTPNPQPLCADSQDLSFQSALDNRSSPRLRPATRSCSQSRRKAQQAAPSQASWHAPPSQISDSYPLPDVGIIANTPTRILQHYLRRTPSVSPSSPENHYHIKSPRPRPNDEVIHVPSSIPIPSSLEPPPSPSLPKPSNIIPVTPYPHKRPPDTDVDTDADADDDQVLLDPNTTHISSSPLSPPSTPSPRAESEPPPSKIPKKLPTQPFARSTSDTGPVRSSDPSAMLAISQSLAIRPPSPPVSISNLDPSSLVSPKLDKLARDLSSRYNPQMNRHVDPFERGYWLVDCTVWSETTRLDTWVFLSNYLRSGLAGWGVWCTRDEDHAWMRFYCWGHVAKHVYLLVYLASGREIKAKGARWLDADGQVVLHMPGVDKV